MKMKQLKITPRRLTLKGWASLDDLRKQIADCEDTDTACDLIFKSIELATEERPNWDEVSWIDASLEFIETSRINQPTIKLPILTSENKEDEMPWEYAGRTWPFWLNVFAKHYGWDEVSIAALDIDTAIALYQEIAVDEQLEKEWQWGLSEKSVEYVQATKKSRFVPLDRPTWMRKSAKPKKVIKTKIRRDMMPQGNIVQLDTDEG